MAVANQTTSDFKGDHFSVKMAGADGGLQMVTDGAISSASTSLTSATGRFRSTDVGHVCHVAGAGAGGVNLDTTIAAFVSYAEVTLTDAASTTVADAEVVWYPDDSTAIEAANQAIQARPHGGVILIPPDVGLGLPDSFLEKVKWLDWRSGSSAAPHRATNSRMPNLFLERFEDTSVIAGAPDWCLLPPIASVARFSMVTGKRSADRAFTLVAEAWDRTRFDNSAYGASPASVNLGAYFSAFGGTGHVKGQTALNTVVHWLARQKGTCDVSGTTVTRLTGSAFETTGGWANTGIEFESVAGVFSYYEIASVESTDSLTLKSAVAAPLSGATFRIGGACIGYELDVNNASGEDVDPDSAVFYNGLAIVSGHNNKPLTGLSIGATFPGGRNNSWRKGALITAFDTIGLHINAVQPGASGAVGIDVTPGSTGNALNARGPIHITGRPTNLLIITPSDDTVGSVFYGTDAANTLVKWSLTKGGIFTLPGIIFSDDNNTTPGALMTMGFADTVRLTPASDSDDPTGFLLYGTNAANSLIKWIIKKTGDALFKTIQLDNLATLRSGIVDPEGAVTGPVGDLYLNSNNGTAWLKTAGVGNTGWQRLFSGSIFTGTGSPEGSVTAPVGSLYLQTDGTQGQTLWVKESGSGNSGWKADAGTLWSVTVVTGAVVDVKTEKPVGIGGSVGSGLNLMLDVQGGDARFRGKVNVGGTSTASKDFEVHGTTELTSTTTLSGLTASSMLALNGSKEVITPSANDARTTLSVYSKAEVDALLDAVYTAMAAYSSGSHTHAISLTSGTADPAAHTHSVAGDTGIPEEP